MFNTKNQSKQIFKTPVALLISIGVGLALVALFFITYEFMSSKSEFDMVDKENSKIVVMMNEQIKYNVNQYNTNDSDAFGPVSNCKTCLPTAKKKVEDYLKTIKQVESYARYGVTSTQYRNLIELKITFNNGVVVNNVHTGAPCSGYGTPHLLLKVLMQNGTATQVFTNGVEKNGSPDWIINDLNVLARYTIYNDVSQNRSDYYIPEKSKVDFDKEWDEKK
jgi:hypothetical protein